MTQCYDVAFIRPMSRTNNGVQAKFSALVEHTCLYVHCHAHKVNLVHVDTCHAVSTSTDLFGLMEAIYLFLIVSILRHDICVQLQRDHKQVNCKLPKQSGTRWVYKRKAVTTFLARFGEICESLEQIISEGKAKERAEANKVYSHNSKML